MIVKKYNNRKLYFDGKYINLSDIITALQNGDDVQVVAHATGLDVTTETLIEALKLINIDGEIIKELIVRGKIV